MSSPHQATGSSEPTVRQKPIGSQPAAASALFENNNRYDNDSGIVDDADTSCVASPDCLAAAGIARFHEPPHATDDGREIFKHNVREVRTPNGECGEISLPPLSDVIVKREMEEVRRPAAVDGVLESAGRRHQMSVERSTVVVSRLDGVSLSTGAPMTLYKCHICGKLFARLGALQIHLGVHADRRLTLFQCRLCDTNFPLRTKLVRHLRARHRLSLQRADADAPASEAGLPMDDVPAVPAVDSGSALMRSSSPSLSSSTPILNLTTTPILRSSSSLEESAITIIPDIIDQSNLSSLAPTRSATEQLRSADQSNHHDPIDAGLSSPKAEAASPARRDAAPSGEPTQEPRRRRLPCRACGAEFRKRRSLLQHTLHCHCDGSADVATVKKQLFGGGGGRHQHNGNSAPRESPRSNFDAAVRNSVLLESVSQAALSKMSNALVDAVRSSSAYGCDGWLAGCLHVGENPQRSASGDLRCKYESGAMGRNGTSTADAGINEQTRSRKECAEQIREMPRESTDRIRDMPRESTDQIRDLQKESADRIRDLRKESADRIRDPPPSPDVANGSSRSEKEIKSVPIKSLLSPQYGGGAKRRQFAAPFSSPSPAKSSPPDDVYKPAGLYSPMPGLLAAYKDLQGCTGDLAPAAAFSLADLSQMFHHGGAGGFLPLPLISLFLSQSALATTSLLSSALPGSGAGLTPRLYADQATDRRQCAALADTGLDGVGTAPQCESSTWEQTSRFADSPPPLAHSPGSATARSADGGAAGERYAPENSREVSGSDGTSDWRATLERRMKGLAAAKGTSLSRTQSRLYVVPEPIKRTEAFKPVLMSDGQTVYRCTYCNKDFSTVSDINRHMDFHEDIRPYKCSHCDYHARTNSQLKVHNMRHQGIRKFQCCLCNYKGVTQSDLNRHGKSQIHMLKARNQCGSCGEGFVSPINLGKHFHDRHIGSSSSASVSALADSANGQR